MKKNFRTAQSFLFTSLLLVVFSVPGIAAMKKDLFVKQLAPLLKPTPFKKGSINSLQNHLIKVMALVEKSDRTYGPKPNELIERACMTHAHSGPQRSIITADIVVKAYEEAKYLGLYDKKGKFNLLIRKGPDTGKKALFEFIVPAEQAPEFSQDLANIRLITPSKKRTPEKSLNPSEKTHLGKLLLIKKEARNRLALLEQDHDHHLDTSYFKADEGPYHDKWLAALEKAGEAANGKPAIRLEAHKRSTASRANGEKMSVWVKTQSEVHVPTKVIVWCFMLGRTDRENIMFKIGESKKEVLMLPRDEQQMRFYSKSFPSLKGLVADLDMLPKKERNQAKFKTIGWVVRVEHNGEFVNGGSSMTILLPFADEKFKELTALP